MAEYSAFPGMHRFLESVPFPGGVSWTEVISTYPSTSHFHWALFFALLCCVVQLLCYVSTKAFAPLLIGYSSTPPLPKQLKVDKTYYVKVGEACGYTQRVDPQGVNYALLMALCHHKLNKEDILQFLKQCNKHHEEIAKNEKRCQECLFPILTKGFTLGFGVLAFYDEAWLYDRSQFGTGFSSDADEQGLACCSADVKVHTSSEPVAYASDMVMFTI